MRFVKMHGLGNDYVYVDADRELVEDAPALSRLLSRSHTGIGSDGLVLYGRSDNADFSMRIFNADGSEAEMCGNAARCIGRYLFERGYTDQLAIKLDTLGGLRILRLTVRQGKVSTVSVDMGEPIMTSKAVGMTQAFPEGGTVQLSVEGHAWEFTPVSTGNPHMVTFVQDVEEADVHGVGRAVEHHPLFPARTNVEFVQVLSPAHIKVRVWERGSGETEACGTGACAAWVASILRGKTGREGTVSLPGGDLELLWDEADRHIYQEGPATIAFEGDWLNE